MSRIGGIFLLSLLSFALGACSQIPLISESPGPAVEPVLSSQTITIENAMLLSEITLLHATRAGPVAALAFAQDMETILAVYSDEGVLRRWQLVDGAVRDMLDVHPVELGAVAFDATREMLATGAGVQWEKHLLQDEYLGLRIWDTGTGEIILRAGEGYDARSGLLTRNLALDILLHPDGDWVLIIDASADNDFSDLKDLTMYEVATGRIGTLFVNFSRLREEDDFDVIAFDARGEFFAAADESGKVAVYLFDPPNYPGRERVLIERSGNALGATPLALAFDPRRQWLAGVRGDELIVWNLQSPTHERQLETKASAYAGLTASLAFDPSGKLLAVGTVDGWQIWDVETQHLLAQGDAAGVYAVTFSPDGRLFAWGDASGIVHIWGVPE